MKRTTPDHVASNRSGTNPRGNGSSLIPYSRIKIRKLKIKKYISRSAHQILRFQYFRLMS